MQRWQALQKPGHGQTSEQPVFWFAPDVNDCRLLADIGGTNARFAWQMASRSDLLDVASYPCADHASLQAVIEHYLRLHNLPKPVHCAIGIANPVVGDHVQMTNRHWAFSITELQTALGLERLLVLNDFTALALSLPFLSRSDLHQVGSGEAVRNESIGLIGPGTGLGVSGLLLSADQRWVPIRGEGGHVSLTASNSLELEVLGWLTKSFGHASAERALSGPGLVNLFDALCAIHGREAPSIQSTAIVKQACADPDGICAQTVALFCGFLGSVAGDLALTLGARGGIYLGGGILPKMLGLLDSSSFRKRFTAKGRFSSYLDAIPTLVLNSTVPAALFGAAAALDG